MKRLHVDFEDKEFKKLTKLKKESGLNWHDFIFRIVLEEEINKKSIGELAASLPPGMFKK